MADRKSSDNTLLTTLADGDLFDVLDSSEPTSSSKNKSITKGDLFTQIGTELSLTGTPALTTINSGFESGYSGTVTIYKLSRLVSVYMSIVVSSPGSGLIYSGLATTLAPNFGASGRGNSSNSSDNGEFTMNAVGQINLYRHGTTATVVSNGTYRVSFFYFSGS